MSPLAIPGEVLPVLGTVGLLGLWLYQQTGIERRSGELQKFDAALAVFQTYQSHNALFNAFEQLLKHDTAGSAQLRIYQVYNYELGLAALEQALTAAQRKGVPPPVSAYEPGDVSVKLEQVQLRLGKLQEGIAAARKQTERAVDDAKKKYLRIYLALSMLSITGAVCAVVAKLNP